MRMPLRYHVTFATVGALLLVAFVLVRTTQSDTRTRRYPLPGEPLPKVDYSRLVSPPPVVQEAAKALVDPLMAGARSLRPLTEYLFPTYWEDPKAPASEAPYAVRDSALRVVRGAI